MNAGKTQFLALFAASILSASCAVAFEKVDLTVGGRDSGTLYKAVKASSGLMNLENKDDLAPDEIIAVARADYARVTETLYASGFYSVEVHVLVDGREAALINPLDPVSAINTVQIVVEPGRRFQFGTVRVAPAAPGTEPSEEFRTGEPARATVVKEVARETVDGWRRSGHAKARVSRQSIRARHDDARLDADIGVDPGPRVSFGDVIVSGQSKVRPNRVRKIAGIPQGEVFSPEAVDKAEKRLRSTGTFRSVQVLEKDQVAPDGAMDVEIKVVDNKPRRFGVGGDVSSFDGLTLSGYWLHRNLFGGAERLRVDGEIAQLGGQGVGVDYSLSFRLEKPAVYGADTLFAAEAGLYYVDEPDYIEEKAEVLLSVSQKFSDQLTGELGIGYSLIQITDLYTTPRSTRELNIVSLPLALTYDTRDDPLDAHGGLYLHGKVVPYREFRSAHNGAHLTFDARAYRALGADAFETVVAGRLQLGTLLGTRAVNAPSDFLFYSGGGGTVRGQPYNSLGADYGAINIGGRSFAALSAELRFPVTEQFGLVVFGDAGFVGPEDFSDGDWHAGAGIGLRYKTPVGPIRFDIAGPVAGKTGNGIQYYVGIGQAF